MNPRATGNLSLPTTVILVATFFCPAIVTADWNETFDGGLQHAWTFGNASNSGTSGTFLAESIEDQLKLSDSIAGINGGATVGFGAVDEVFKNVLVTGTTNAIADPFISPTQALLARGDIANGTFYAAEINYFDSKLSIFRNDSLTSFTSLASVPITGLNTASEHYLEFLIRDSTLTATAFDTAGGTELATVSTTDTSFSEGFAGVFVRNSLGDNLIGVWDDVAAINPPPFVADLACDLDNDGDCDQDDLAKMFDLFGTVNADLDYDMNGTVGPEDIDGWLANASVPENPIQSGDITFVRGDLDLDGMVDNDDLAALLANFGGEATDSWQSGDVDGDGVVNNRDLGLLLNRFGHQPMPTIASTSVPEPPSFSLLGLAMLNVLLTRRSKR